MCPESYSMLNCLNKAVTAIRLCLPCRLTLSNGVSYGTICSKVLFVIALNISYKKYDKGLTGWPSTYRVSMQ